MEKPLSSDAVAERLGEALGLDHPLAGGRAGVDRQLERAALVAQQLGLALAHRRQLAGARPSLRVRWAVIER